MFKFFPWDVWAATAIALVAAFLVALVGSAAVADALRKIISMQTPAAK